MDKTLLKGLAVLEAVAEMQGQAHVIEDVATRVGLSRSNTHRTLQTLMYAGYVERDPVTGEYRGTVKLFSLGMRQFGRMDVRSFAPPFMSALAKETGETIHLSILDGPEVIYIDKIDSVQAVRAYTEVGGRAPAHAVATGKALLAAGGEPALDRLPSALPRFTQATITDLTALRAELTKSARLGYAVNRGEWRQEVGGMASPVFNGLRRPVAAIGISGPLNRLSAARMKSLAPYVVQAAAQLSKSLGHTDNPGSAP